MTLKQFKDEPLSHYSYAIISDGKMALIDPSRNPLPYYKYAEEQNATIVAVFETHPHADFVSGHLQIHEQTGADIYVSKLVGADYPHKAFDEGKSVKIGKIIIKALHTPGHSPDSLTFVASENSKTVLFTGDTLFIGDVGRPDLREKGGNKKSKRIELAKAMYNTMQTKFNDLPDHAFVYPTHGAGSLCGKNMSDAASSTLGEERRDNWAFKKQTEEEFVAEILKDQPMIPAYFDFNVDLNKQGAGNVQKMKFSVGLQLNVSKVEKDVTVVDVRDEEEYKEAHLPGSINIMARGESDKFETWLGAIVKPKESFYLVVKSVGDLDTILERTAKIGYEKQLKGILTLAGDLKTGSDDLEISDFKKNKEEYTIVDIRNKSEVEEEGKVFESAIVIPLNELRDRAGEVPKGKPVVVHCAGGYRSAAGSSILENHIKKVKVFDLGEAIKKFS
ncbi:MAG: rhodanese-like domain-containing protein [Gillisia sp.]